MTNVPKCFPEGLKRFGLNCGYVRGKSWLGGSRFKKKKKKSNIPRLRGNPAAVLGLASVTLAETKQPTKEELTDMK